MVATVCPGARVNDELTSEIVHPSGSNSGGFANNRNVEGSQAALFWLVMETVYCSSRPAGPEGDAGGVTTTGGGASVHPPTKVTVS